MDVSDTVRKQKPKAVIFEEYAALSKHGGRRMEKAFGSKHEEVCNSSCSVKHLAIHTLGQCYWSQMPELCPALCPQDMTGMRSLQLRKLIKASPFHPFPHLQAPELSQPGRFLQVIFRKQGKRLEGTHTASLSVCSYQPKS